MDLILKHVQNEIGDIELGDVFWSDVTNHYYIVVIDEDERKFYYLKDLSGVGSIQQISKHNSLSSLRQSLVKASSCKFIHYPAKEYRLELVRNLLLKEKTND